LFSFFYLRCSIRRVLTRRLRTTGNFTTFVRSIDVKVVGILLAKRLVTLATHGESSRAIKEDIDAQVKETCAHFGTERREASGGASYELPSELNILPLLLFHVRRGPLLGPILQSEDDIDVARHLFLTANRADALRFCIPTLLSWNQKGELEELPMETLALQSNRILFLDHQTQILIWSGSEVTGPQFNSYRKACQDRANGQSAHRLPKPEILSFNEGSSASRWLQVRLIPSHKDSPQWQETTFPQLKYLTPQQREQLLEKFLPTDEPSFVQWYSALFK
jgi:protein transport protein SEC23